MKITLIALSTHVYRLLLYLYPAAFRREFGREMQLAFRDYCRMITERDGLFGLIQLWLPTLIDLSATAFVERLKELTNMSQNPIIRFCGAAGIIGGTYLLFNGLTGLTGNIYFGIPAYIIPFYAIGLTACVIGLFLFTETLTARAKVGIGITLLGTAVISLGLVLMYWFNVDAGWGLWRSGHLLHIIGLLFFGLTVQGLPIRWKVVPGLIGGLSILLFAAAITTNSMFAAAGWDFVQGIGWFLIGGMLINDTRSQPASTQPVVG